MATTDDTQDTAAGGRAPAAREDPRTPGNDGQVDPHLRTIKLRNLRNCESSRQSLTRIASVSPNSSGLSCETNRTRTAGGSVVVLERYINRSSGMRSQSHSSAASLEPARTSWKQPCCYVTCLSLQTPRHDAFETRCRVCSTWRPYNKPRAQPVDVEGRPQKNALSQPGTRGRHQFITGHPLEVGKWCPSRSASSTIEGNTTLDMTSTSTAAAGTGTSRNTATALTVVDVTIATRTRWLQSHQALESSAGQSAVRRYQGHSDPQPAS